VAYYLAIDGGGSKTDCAVGDEGSVLGKGTAGGSNPLRVGEVRARQALQDAIAGACRSAGIAPAQISQACIGIAGASRPAIAGILRDLLAAVICCPLQIVSDAAIALQAAFSWGPGVVVIAGTGSVAYGRGPAGEIARAGGWGPAISDEGSGYWIGRTAVAAALRSCKETQLPELMAAVLQAWNLPDPDGLILAVNTVPPPDFSMLSPIVMRRAEAGDALAGEVLREAGKQLAQLGSLVVGRLFGEQIPVPLSIGGGVFRHSLLVRQSFYNCLREQCPGIRLQPGLLDPLQGALELARNPP
jgi:N-acetylglucosamine kinase-like BadF-type ATPase